MSQKLETLQKYLEKMNRLNHVCTLLYWDMRTGAPKEGFDAIPMWIADMNFATVPTVQEAIIERVKHPTFGYFSPTEEYFNSIIRWQEKRNGVTGLRKEHIGYENGVYGGKIVKRYIDSNGNFGNLGCSLDQDITDEVAKELILQISNEIEESRQEI